MYIYLFGFPISAQRKHCEAHSDAMLLRPRGVRGTRTTPGGNRDISRVTSTNFGGNQREQGFKLKLRVYQAILIVLRKHLN